MVASSGTSSGTFLFWIISRKFLGIIFIEKFSWEIIFGKENNFFREIFSHFSRNWLSLMVFPIIFSSPMSPYLPVLPTLHALLSFPPSFQFLFFFPNLLVVCYVSISVICANLAQVFFSSSFFDLRRKFAFALSLSSS
uniref:Wsv460 n=1 Tax=Ascaris lumbricoides TaxID=6252 RepID=A0A0M3IR39_ASCLU